MKNKKSAILFLNGEMDLKKDFYREFFKGCIEDIYCADGGLTYARRLNLIPKEIWGDLDSVDSQDIEWAKEKGIFIAKFPSEKDETDGELIIRYLKGKGYERIKIFSGTGGRTDHFLTNLNLSFRYEGLEFYNEREKIFTLKKKNVLRGIQGKTISFVPFSDRVTGLTLKGMKYPLDNCNLERGSSLCMSNIALENEVEIEFTEGKLLGIIENS